MIYSKKKRGINPMLMNVILVSVVIHVLAGLILGSITIAQYVIPDDTQFEEPPAVEQEEPPREVKVEIKPPSAPLKQPLNNLKTREVGNITVGSVNVDLPSMNDNFTVSAGLGGSLRNSSLMNGARGSIGLGISNINVFGLKTRAERILFLIDASRHMMTDEKGGLNSYNTIKDEITHMVSNLSSGTLFNVAFYDRKRVYFFKPKLVSANSEISSELEAWVAPVNSDAGAVGLEAGNQIKISALSDKPMHGDLGSSGARSNENALLTQLALEQNADAIFIITGFHDGFQRVRRKPTEGENTDWAKTTSSEKYKLQLAAHEAEKPDMEKRIKSKTEQINKERASKGMPPKIFSKQWGIYSHAGDLGLKWKTPHPGWQPGYYRDVDEVERYFDELVEELYTSKGGDGPSINVVLFLAGDENYSEDKEKSLKDYVRTFGGKHRIIRGLNEIRAASSAQETTN